MTTDRIEREITIAAPMERVWAVLTVPEHVGVWFGTGAPATIDLRPGGTLAFDHGESSQYLGLIVDVDPPRAFSFRWAAVYPGVVATEENSTLVEFTLEPAGDGTLLRVVESGFDALVVPPDRVEFAGYESHSNGWAEVITKFGELAEGGTVAPLVPPR
jgi:uncharacterized protein YndB with AHSA1/START domain